MHIDDSHKSDEMSVDRPAAGPTPPQEEQPNGAYASYVPHDLAYSAEFEDSLMDLVLNGPRDPHDLGIRIIPDGSNEQPVNGVSVRAEDVSLQSLPTIHEDQLPLPLDDKRRIFASPVPGIKLTHPGGYLEGGPGLEPEMDTFPEDFLSTNPHVRNAEQLRAAVDRKIAEDLGDLKQRMEARKRAIEHNEQIEKELKDLMEQHSMELKVSRKLAEERRAKKEAKQRRKMEREGG